MNNIRRKCNPTIKFLKFTLNVKIYEKFVRFLFKLVWRETQQKFHFRVNFFCNPNA